jgi:hypothetical protein
LFALLLAAHLCHSGVLWGEEDLPLAAALRMLHGGVLYRDIWFDKPPLLPTVYLLWGARIGPVLRVAGALYAFLCCLLAYAFAAQLWSRREGYAAAGLFGFFLTFDTHSAVLPLAADLLLLAPHLAAVLLASRRQFFLAGMAAGIGFLFNAKGVFVLAACMVFVWPWVIPGLIAMLAGFVVPNIAAAGWLVGTGSAGPYIDQVWRWGAQYAASPVVADPVWNGVVRTLNWLGFHAVLVIGVGAYWFTAKKPPATRSPALRFVAWVGICLVGVALGWRFFPRYYFLLLPALAIPAARGLTSIRSRAVMAIALLTMAVPLVRFGPRYATLANSKDLAMDRDSREASAIAVRNAPPGGSLYVWGYRPEMYLYTGLRPATRFLECQAMTGVPADRHLTSSEIVLTSGTHEAREELARSRPDVLIDGLSLYNPALAMDRYTELRAWLAGYREVARTKDSVIYVRPTTIRR